MARKTKSTRPARRTAASSGRPPTPPAISDEEFHAKGKHLLAFMETHPELKDAVGMWMADRCMCETLYPEAVEILSMLAGAFEALAAPRAVERDVTLIAGHGGAAREVEISRIQIDPTAPSAHHPKFDGGRALRLLVHAVEGALRRRARQSEPSPRGAGISSFPLLTF